MKTKTRAHQLHFGTGLSSKLPIGFENGPLEVWYPIPLLAQKQKWWICWDATTYTEFKRFLVWGSNRLGS